MKVNTIWCCLIIIMLFFAGSAFCDDSADEVLWGSNYAVGNVVPSGSAAIEFDDYEDAVSLGLYPSLEVILFKPQVGGLAFADFGIEGGGRFGLPLVHDDLSMGAYGAGTMHFGFKGLDIPGSEVFDRIDLYAKLGLGMDIVDKDPGLRLRVASGVNYFLNDRLFVGAGYTDWADNSGFALNLGLRIGKTPTVNGMAGVWKDGADAIAAVEESVYLTRFYTLMAFAFYSGGYFWAPDSYTVGSGIVWQYDDGEDQFYVERLLLEKESDGSTWWRMRFYDDTEEIVYEFRLDAGRALTTILYRDSEGTVKEYNYESSSDTVLAEGDVADEDYIASLSRSARRENVKVPAGSFPGCYVVEQKDETGSYIWYFSDTASVNGGLVKTVSSDEEGDMTGVLYSVLSGRRGDFLLK